MKRSYHFPMLALTWASLQSPNVFTIVSASDRPRTSHSKSSSRSSRPKTKKSSPSSKSYKSSHTSLDVLRPQTVASPSSVAAPDLCKTFRGMDESRKDAEKQNVEKFYQYDQKIPQLYNSRSVLRSRQIEQRERLRTAEADRGRVRPPKAVSHKTVLPSFCKKETTSKRAQTAHPCSTKRVQLDSSCTNSETTISIIQRKARSTTKVESPSKKSSPQRSKQIKWGGHQTDCTGVSGWYFDIFIYLVLCPIQ